MTGYRVQWKSGTEAWDGSETSTRQAVLGDPAAASHTIAALANGTAYTVRVVATNAAGDGAAAEAEATVQERVAPVLTGAAVDGAVLTLTYSEALGRGPSAGAGARSRSRWRIRRAGSTGMRSRRARWLLTLASAVVSGETVTVGYTVPADAGAARIEDAAGNAAGGFTGEAVTNETGASDTAPTGLPAISGTAEVGEELSASADDIADADGLENVTFTWQWLANDGTDDTEIADATGATHEVAPAEVGQTLKVRVTFTDDKGTEETLVSAATEVVVDRRPVAATLSVGDGAAEVGRFRLRIAFADAVTGLAAADFTAARVGGDATAVSDLAEAETGRVWTRVGGRRRMPAATRCGSRRARRGPASAGALGRCLRSMWTRRAMRRRWRAPVVTAVSLAPAGDGSWTDGDAVRITLGFSEPVTVATDGGTPSVGIALDGTARQAALCRRHGHGVARVLLHGDGR